MSRTDVPLVPNIHVQPLITRRGNRIVLYAWSVPEKEDQRVETEAMLAVTPRVFSINADRMVYVGLVDIGQGLSDRYLFKPAPPESGMSWPANTIT